MAIVTYLNADRGFHLVRGPDVLYQNSGLETGRYITPLEYADLAYGQDLQYCEFFAGGANAYRAITTAGYPSCAVDITYLQGGDTGSSNPFDFLTSSGLAWLASSGCLPICIFNAYCGASLSLSSLSPSLSLALEILYEMDPICHGLYTSGYRSGLY